MQLEKATWQTAKQKTESKQRKYTSLIKFILFFRYSVQTFIHATRPLPRRPHVVPHTHVLRHHGRLGRRQIHFDHFCRPLLSSSSSGGPSSSPPTPSRVHASFFVFHLAPLPRHPGRHAVVARPSSFVRFVVGQPCPAVDVGRCRWFGPKHKPSLFQHFPPQFEHVLHVRVTVPGTF